MATITKGFTFAAGATIVASEHNNNFDILYNDYNGNIQNANFSASAAIVDSKLAQITTTSKVSNTALTVASHTNGDLFFYSGTNLWTRFARGTASQSLKCQHDSQTVLLLHFDGTDGATVFTDSSLSIKTVTANGDVQIDTAQSKFGGASGLFDGTGDYLTLADHADWNFGAGDFTIDFWVRFNTSVNEAMVFEQWGTATTKNFVIDLTPTVILFYYSTNGSTIQNKSVTWSPAANIWYHIAIVRNGNDLMFFVNGNQQGNTQDFTGVTLYNSSDALHIGQNIAILDLSAIYALNGWLDELRISKGIARWTANFTPPTSAYTPEDLIWVT